MRRITTLVVLAVVATGAALMSPPEPPDTPDFEAPVVDVQFEAPASASVWHCPWVNADAQRDAVFLLASATEADATITMPSPVVNAEPDTSTVPIVGPGSRVVDVGAIIQRGDTPGFVEFSDGPAVAGAAVIGEGLIAADRCVAATPKIWHLAGGTTRAGRILQLRLFNPVPDDVKVSITGASEFGPEPLPEFNSVLVRGRSWVNIDLNPVVPLLDDLSLVVAATDGVVIPVMALSGEEPGTDRATWPGGSLSTQWYFANATQAGLSPTLALTNPGDFDATVTVDVLTRTESIPAIVEVTVPAGSPLRVPFADLVSGAFGVSVSSTEPIGAVVIAEDLPPDPGQGADPSEQQQTRFRLAGTVGADQAATSWLLPGAGGVPDAASTIWIMNPSGAAATVSLEPLGVRDLAVAKVIVEPGRIRRFDVPDDVAIASYLVSAPEPIVVSLTARTQASMAFLTGVPIDG